MFRVDVYVHSFGSLVLDIFKEAKIPDHAREMGEILYKELEEVQKEFPDLVVDHRGKGLIQGLEFSDRIKASDIVKEALLTQHMVLIGAEHNTIRFVPPLIIEKYQIQDMKERLTAAMKALQKETH